MFRKDINDGFDSKNHKKKNQPKTRGIAFWIGDNQQINSDYIFNQKQLKKKTKGYDTITGEIDKRGKPADNQDEIFMKIPEKPMNMVDIIKDRKKKAIKKRESYHTKLYRDRLKTKWDRSW